MEITADMAAVTHQKARVEDVVNKPSHYKLFPDKEVIDIITEVLTEEELIGYLRGNILKYRLRAGYKDNALQDLSKAEKYREWLYGSYRAK